MYRQSSGKKLYLRRQVPDRDYVSRLREILRQLREIAGDRDYGSRIIRVLSVSDLPAEDIVCLVDPVATFLICPPCNAGGLPTARPVYSRSPGPTVQRPSPLFATT